MHNCSRLYVHNDCMYVVHCSLKPANEAIPLMSGCLFSAVYHHVSTLLPFNPGTVV